MMWWNHNGWGWAVILGLAMIACMGMMARMMMRHGTSGHTGQSNNRDEDAPEGILAKRLANGEIDVEEYKRLRDALHRPNDSPADAAEHSRAERHPPAA